MTGPDPIERFRALLAQAVALPRERVAEPTAFCLATADAEGRPSARMLLLKDADERGFVFYTNFESRKGRELLVRPWAALCFHWQPLEVQVRVEGSVAPVEPQEADAYFASRPRGSQIGAWASEQSRAIASRGDLEARVAEMTRRFEGGPVPRPPHWSGFRLAPARMEFWKNMPSRLHDRDAYIREGGTWRVEKLYP